MKSSLCFVISGEASWWPPRCEGKTTNRSCSRDPAIRSNATRKRRRSRRDSWACSKGSSTNSEGSRKTRAEIRTYRTSYAIYRGSDPKLEVPPAFRPAHLTQHITEPRSTSLDSCFVDRSCRTKTARCSGTQATATLRISRRTCSTIPLLSIRTIGRKNRNRPKRFPFKEFCRNLGIMDVINISLRFTSHGGR